MRAADRESAFKSGLSLNYGRNGFGHRMRLWRSRTTGTHRVRGQINQKQRGLLEDIWRLLDARSSPSSGSGGVIGVATGP